SASGQRREHGDRAVLFAIRAVSAQRADSASHRRSRPADHRGAGRSAVLFQAATLLDQCAVLVFAGGWSCGSTAIVGGGSLTTTPSFASACCASLPASGKRQRSSQIFW